MLAVVLMWKIGVEISTIVSLMEKHNGHPRCIPQSCPVGTKAAAVAVAAAVVVAVAVATMVCGCPVHRTQ